MKCANGGMAFNQSNTRDNSDDITENIGNGERDMNIGQKGIRFQRSRRLNHTSSKLHLKNQGEIKD